MYQTSETNNNLVSNLVQFPLFQPEALPPVTPPARKPAVKSTSAKNRIIKFAVPKPVVTRADLERQQDVEQLCERVELSFVSAVVARKERKLAEKALDDPIPAHTSRQQQNTYALHAEANSDQRIEILTRHVKAAILDGISAETLIAGIVECLNEIDGLLCPDFKESK